MCKRNSREWHSENKHRSTCVRENKRILPLAGQSDLFIRSLVRCVFFWSEWKVCSSTHFYCFRDRFFQLFAFNYSQSRGINIPLECVTDLFHGQSIKNKFFKRKGFSKAYDEMQFFIDSSATTSKVSMAGAIENKNKNAKKTHRKLVTTVRRSPRLNNSGVRRSTRLQARLQGWEFESACLMWWAAIVYRIP